MTDFDELTPLKHYLDLSHARPELFTNPAGRGYQILTAPREIEEARQQARSHRLAHGLPADDTRVGMLSYDPYLTALRDAVRFPDGTLGLYNRLLVAPGVAILPLLGKQIVLIRRFRHGTRAYHYEAPRGMISDPDRIEEDARRELKEEIDATANELILLGRMHPTSGIVDEVMTMYFARIDAFGEPERNEAIAEIGAFSILDVERMIADGGLTDGPTLGAFLQARILGLL